jgi:hypothetical protein
MFILTSDITIGNFRFSGVHDIQIQSSIYSIVSTAIIKIPSISKITVKDKANPDLVITGNQFKEGDPVTIKLGYNNELKTEFTGFVKSRNLNMPLEIECEGYSWLLRRNNISGFWNTIALKKLLEEAVSGLNAGYKINVRCDIDITLNNLTINKISGFDLIEDIAKYTDNALAIFFIQPDTLWCGNRFTPLANGTDVFNLGTFDYRLGYNAMDENQLTQRNPGTDLVQVIYSKRLPDGSKVSENSDVYNHSSYIRSKVLNHMSDSGQLKQLANERAYQMNYLGYEGTITAFLQPFASPGCLANIADARYPGINGRYVIESTQVNYGINGARRIIEIGPKVGFAKS